MPRDIALKTLGRNEFALLLENQGSLHSITDVAALESEIAETLKSLDPLRAKAFERAIHELLLVVRPEA